MPSGRADASGRISGRVRPRLPTEIGGLAETIASARSWMTGTSLETGPRMVNLERSSGILSWQCVLLAGCAWSCAVDDGGVSGQSRDTRVDVADHAPDAAVPEPDAATTEPSFVDAAFYFEAPEDIDAWYDLIAELKGDFDAVCGDTFCEGDYSNLESLRLRCSVEESAGTVGSCVWVFGASNEEIEPATGSVTVQGEIFACQMPVAPDTGIRDLVAALLAPGVQPIRAILPGTDASFYDGLVDCL
jgi:hypothetical protein